MVFIEFSDIVDKSTNLIAVNSGVKIGSMEAA